MADTEAAIDAAATWWACLGALGHDLPGPASPINFTARNSASQVQALLVPRIWQAFDPLVREPLADVVFPLSPDADDGASAARWAFGMAPRAPRPGTALAQVLVDATATRFMATRRRLVGHLGESTEDIASTKAALLLLGSTVLDYPLASSLYDRAESSYRRSGWPTWFAYPDDLAIVEFRLARPARFLMTRRGDRWFILLPPETFESMAPRLLDDGGDAAGVREPRNPLAPILSDHAEVDEPLP